MRFGGRASGLAAGAILLAGIALAHESDGDPTAVFDNWRDNFIPFFDNGDPDTRHDGVSGNDEGRDNPETRRSDQRWRDEVKSDGSTEDKDGNTIPDTDAGCLDTFCIAVADQEGDVARVDHSLAVGPSSRQGDRNAVVVELLGGGTEVNLGPSQKLGPLGLPDVTQAGVAPPTPPDPFGRGAPTELHAMSAGDHSLAGGAHTNSNHESATEGNHDAHGGTLYADVFLPSADDLDRIRDTKAGIVIMDHLGCEFGCSDEYHTFYPADLGRTNWQVSEMPDQAEFVARSPDRWLFGMGSDGQPRNDRLDPVLAGPAATVFDNAVNPHVDPAVANATGAGATSSLCCAVDSGGNSCIPGVARNASDAYDREAFGGCVEIDAQNCFGGGSFGIPPENNGCVVIAGMPFVHGMPAQPEDCTAAAVAGCCSAGACQ